MRRSIRTQILLPLLVVQGTAVVVATLAAAGVAASASERQVVGRLNGVIDSLDHGNFPYTATVLEQMRGLSGAEFVALDRAGTVAVASVPVTDEMARSLRGVALAAHLTMLGSAAPLRAGDVPYRAIRLASRSRPSGSSLVVLYPETAWRQARRDAVVPPLLFGAASLVLTTAAAGWVAHRIGGRLKRLERQVALIAAGDFQELELRDARDEVHDLSRSINAMCAELRRMSEAIRQSERAHLLAQLGAGLAHQLRNALTGARLSIQLHRRRHPVADGDRSLDVALRQLAMTEELVRGLLSLGRLEQRPPVVFDPGRLLDDVATLVGPACEHAGIACAVRPSRATLMVRADESGVRAAVLNLALNAIEAAGPGGQVTLGLDTAEDGLTFDVSDNGPGPPAGIADSLFQPFITGKPEGTGLGLALAQQVAAAHGGRLAWDRNAGRTHFRLWIPRVAGALRDAV